MACVFQVVEVYGIVDDTLKIAFVVADGQGEGEEVFGDCLIV